MNYKVEWPDSILRWDEAVPLGSGKCGCLCWGTPEELRFSLDRTDIWEKRGRWSPDESFTYRKLQELAKAGDTERLREIFDAPYYEPTPTKLSPGKLLLHFEGEVGEGNVQSSLCLRKATANLTIYAAKNRFHIRTWIHATRHVGVVEVEAPAETFTCELKKPEFGTKDKSNSFEYDVDNRHISQGSTLNLRYEPAQWGSSYEEGVKVQWFVQPLYGDEAYGIVTAKKDFSTGSRIIWNIVSSQDGENWLEEGKREILDCQRLEAEVLFEEHCTWWQKYFEKSSICIPDKCMEAQWYLTNYLFASCSREGVAPMPLQGVWTADDGLLPPWKGDYHHDLNTELSYSHYLKANHLDEGRCFLDFLWNLLEEGKHFAEKFYGTKGCCLPGVMTIDGKPLGGWPMYSLSPTNQIWLCQAFIRYYQYTDDEKFLREKAYPYVRETGECMEGLLEKQEDGTLCLPVSSSPEIHDDTEKAWLTPMSNYDLALLHYLFQSLYEMAEKIEAPEIYKWKKLKEKLPQLAVNEKNVLMLSPDESLKESHRHFSNAMAISPLGMIRASGEGKTIIDAVIADYERLGTSQWVGYTFAWMAHLYAIQGNGTKAAKMLQIFWNDFCGPNGFHLNGDYKKKGHSQFTYRPFTLEGNMFSADALQEMLLQTRRGEVRLFPAIPEKWKEQEVGFFTFRGEGGLLCSAVIQPGKNVSWEIQSEREQTVCVYYGNKKVKKFLKLGEGWKGQIDI